MSDLLNNIEKENKAVITEAERFDSNRKTISAVLKDNGKNSKLTLKVNLEPILVNLASGGKKKRALIQEFVDDTETNIKILAGKLKF
jgi:hypothetical protein